MISNENRDYYAGALMVLVGVGAAVIGSRYQLGTLTKMGPGFVPTALGVLLAIMGLAIAYVNWLAQRSGEEIVGISGHGIAGASDKPDWWGWGCIIGGVLAFLLCAEYAGLLPATFFCVFIAARGDRTATWASSFLLASGITVFGIFLFSWVLHVQIPIIRGL
jgi:hypothetical protein